MATLLLRKPRLTLVVTAAALGLAMVLNGCASPQDASASTSGTSSTSGVARSWGEAWERVRHAIATGRAFDDGMLAARGGNRARIESAQNTLVKLGEGAGARALALQWPLSRAEEEVRHAFEFSTQAQNTADAAQKQKLQEQESQSYRSALSLARQDGGEFSSPDPLLLNAVGYFLADKGTSRDDFEQAIRLTRAAVARYDLAVTDAARDGEASVIAARFLRSNTRDSLAWALFKSAQTKPESSPERVVQMDQAQREQEAALAEARACATAWDKLDLRATATTNELRVPAELLFHLALILRAQNAAHASQSTSPSTSGSSSTTREARAQSLLREALKLEPDFAPAKQALQPSAKPEQILAH